MSSSKSERRQPRQAAVRFEVDARTAIKKLLDSLRAISVRTEDLAVKRLVAEAIREYQYHRVRFKQSPSEHSSLTARAAAAHLTISDYVRHRALGMPIHGNNVSADLVAALVEFVAEFRARHPADAQTLAGVQRIVRIIGGEE